MSSFKDKVGRLLDRAIPTFGETIRYQSQEYGSYDLEAVFDADFLIIDPDTEVVVSSNQPRIGVKLADLVGEPKKGDSLIIDNHLYYVDDSQEDGQGGAAITLTKAK